MRRGGVVSVPGVYAGFIHAFGLTKKIHLNLLDYAYRTYKGISEHEQKAQKQATGDAPSAFDSMRLYERTLRNDRPPIRLLGLFDTVASVIEPGKWGPQLKTHPFTHRNASVQMVRHAVAIDERRTMFQPELWPSGQPYWGGPFQPRNSEAIRPQDVKEVWFAGVHGDVGGGVLGKQVFCGLQKQFFADGPTATRCARFSFFRRCFCGRRHLLIVVVSVCE